MNDSMDPFGLVPSLLVFVCFPSFPAPHQTKPWQVDRFKALALRNIEQNVSEQLIRRALSWNLSPASKLKLRPGDTVRVYREDVQKWLGPYTISRLQHKTIHISDGKIRPFNITQDISATAQPRDHDWKKKISQLTQTKETAFHPPTSTWHQSTSCRLCRIHPPALTLPSVSRPPCENSTDYVNENYSLRFTWRTYQIQIMCSSGSD